MTMKTKKVQLKKTDFKEVQQDLTELNGDGNRERGRYGEDESKQVVEHDKCGTPECCGECDTADTGEGPSDG